MKRIDRFEFAVPDVYNQMTTILTLLFFCLLQGRSPQLSSRRYLVDWLAAICDRFNLCAASKHLTILLLDLFMDTYDVQVEHLKLLCVGCLLLACTYLASFCVFFPRESGLFVRVVVIVM